MPTFKRNDDEQMFVPTYLTISYCRKCGAKFEKGFCKCRDLPLTCRSKAGIVTAIYQLQTLEEI